LKALEFSEIIGETAGTFFGIVFGTVVFVAIVCCFIGFGYFVFRFIASRSQRARRGKRILNSWLLTCCVFSFVALGAVLQLEVGKELSLLSCSIAVIPALLLSLLHAGWFFLGSYD
jgi:hypothetical protein